MESRRNFLRRVKAETGRELDSLPRGEVRDVLGGAIVCRRERVWVVGLGHPTETNVGLVFDEYIVIDQTDDHDLSCEIVAINDPEDLLWVVKAAREAGFETVAHLAMDKAMEIAGKDNE